MQYKIIEQKGKDSTGMVGYSVIAPFKRLAEFVCWEDAKDIVEKNIRPGDTVVEVHSMGTVKLTAEEFLAKQEKIRKWNADHSNDIPF